MAAAFKSATVNASSVPSTQSNFPSYVDLSRIGITTLAEAQSVRVYSDSGKTTELAREIVSATEMHVKVPSLTSTTTIYVDYDGVRSDYAATDTYGRNAVWSDYWAVYHMVNGAVYENATGGPDGSVGGLLDGSVAAPTTTTGYIGDGLDFSTRLTKRGFSTNVVYDLNNATKFSNARWTVQGWFNTNESYSGSGYIFAFDDQVLNGVLMGSTSKLRAVMGNGTAVSSSGNYNDGSWHQFHFIKDANTSGYLKINGGSESLAITAGSTYNQADKPAIGLVDRATAVAFYGDYLDEVRVMQTAVSNDWITTEYNNQSAESTFWGTWSDVGDAAAFVPKISIY